MKDLLTEDQMNSRKYTDVVNSFCRPGERIPAVIYEPSDSAAAKEAAILVMHSDEDYLSFSAGEELAKRGFTCMCANVAQKYGDLDKKIENAACCFNFLKEYTGGKKIILLGHSGGATLMSAYQSIAENGPQIYQHEGMFKKCPDTLKGLTPADAVMLLDPNWGNAAMRLFSMDPAVSDESDSHSIDPALDLFNPANGFTEGGSTYSDEFVARFFMGQHERNRRLNDHVLGRIAALDAGCGTFDDDEPLTIAGTEQGFFNNKLYAQDIRFMSHTRDPHTLLHADGSATMEIVHSLRHAENDVSFTQSYGEGALITSIRNYLSSFAIRTFPDYHFDESTVYGIDWDSNYNCTTGNIRFVNAPLLVMGMTGGWEFSSCETIYDNAGSMDKTLAYVEGADHFFRPCTHLEKYEGQFGDTLTLTYDFVCKWIQERF